MCAVSASCLDYIFLSENLLNRIHIGIYKTLNVEAGVGRVEMYDSNNVMGFILYLVFWNM